MLAGKILSYLKRLFQCCLFFVLRKKTDSPRNASREKLLSESLSGSLGKWHRDIIFAIKKICTAPPDAWRLFCPAGRIVSVHIIANRVSGWEIRTHHFTCSHRSPVMDENTNPEEYLALLKEKLSRLMPAPTRFEAAIPGVMLSRFDRDTPPQSASISPSPP